jgi:hypothetical protein
VGLSLDPSGRTVAKNGRTAVFRCSEGRLFRVNRLWRIRRSPVARLGLVLYMRCPVGRHWALVKLAKEEDLTEQERQSFELQPFNYVGETVAGSIGLLNGAVCLTIAIVTQIWWIAGIGALSIALWGAALVVANRRQAIEQRKAGASEDAQIKRVFEDPPGKPPS